jgi:hypothetical protein
MLLKAMVAGGCDCGYALSTILGSAFILLTACIIFCCAMRTPLIAVRTANAHSCRHTHTEQRAVHHGCDMLPLLIPCMKGWSAGLVVAAAAATCDVLCG